jgi:hypothetical protein
MINFNHLEGPINYKRLCFQIKYIIGKSNPYGINNLTISMSHFNLQFLDQRFLGKLITVI